MYNFPNPSTKIGNLIKRRRLQILVHSYIYYHLDENIVSDSVFDSWAKELAILLRDHPNEYSDRFDFAFEGFDGTTGFHFPRDPWIEGKAVSLLKGIKD
jgi:NAD-dependent DNA ligase